MLCLMPDDSIVLLTSKALEIFPIWKSETHHFQNNGSTVNCKVYQK